MSPDTTGEEAVETAYLKGNFHSTAPSLGDTATNPLWTKKITCRTPWIVAITGVACVIFSSCPFHTTAPVVLLSPSSDSPAPPPATNTKSPSTTGEAAFFQPMLRPACSLRSSLIHTCLPVAASRQRKARSGVNT